MGLGAVIRRYKIRSRHYREDLFSGLNPNIDHVITTGHNIGRIVHPNKTVTDPGGTITFGRDGKPESEADRLLTIQTAATNALRDGVKAQEIEVAAQMEEAGVTDETFIPLNIESVGSVPGGGPSVYIVLGIVTIGAYFFMSDRKRVARSA